jgi:hypothetical protein
MNPAVIKTCISRELRAMNRPSPRPLIQEWEKQEIPGLHKKIKPAV